MRAAALVIGIKCHAFSFLFLLVAHCMPLFILMLKIDEATINLAHWFVGVSILWRC